MMVEISRIPGQYIISLINEQHAVIWEYNAYNRAMAQDVATILSRRWDAPVRWTIDD